ncbi:MAG TPA: RodZ domain-containing protein [Candidatus Acidoferrales bacterium]|jgi:transcriptional regulator with XRE-family HTH domain|nr:RodZ domain-containing protein [Candidatus Acidoferrales bacterium]
MSSTPFGEHLRREREMRGVSLDEISAATRISTRFLEAIEKDQWDQLPGGVFNRGFIRSIARFLGLDEDSLVAEYALGTASDVHVHVTTQRARQMPRNWRPAVAAVFAIALFAVAGVTGYHRYGSGLGAWLHASFLTAGGGARAGVSSGQSVAPGPGISSGLPAGDPAAGLALRIHAGKPAKVRIIADGKVVFDGPVRPNDWRQFGARDTFEITSSESGALSLELNGQTVPPMGTSGQPGSVTLTRNDLKPATGGSH